MSLRESYKASSVSVNYDEAGTAAAYMLGYYPKYVLTAYDLLADAIDYIKPPISAVVVCCGPLPEALALACRLQERGGGKLSVLGLDKCADGWAISAT
jgi:hypothetical protein